MNWNPPEVPTPGIAGGGKREGETFGKTGKFFVKCALMAVVLFFRLCAFAPRLERDKEERAVSVLHQTEQAKSDDAGRVLNAWSFAENVFDFAAGLIGPFERSGVG